MFPKITTFLIICSNICDLSADSDKKFFVNDIRVKNSVDFAFNFIDADTYPNGIMIKKDNFTAIYNDDLISRTWKHENEILAKFRKNNFTAGFSIKYVPRCKESENSDYCKNLNKAKKLQMLVFPDLNNTKGVHFIRDNKYLSTDDIPWFSKSYPKVSELLPFYWSVDTDLVAYSSVRYEMVLIALQTKQIFWFSIRDKEWPKPNRHKSLEYFQNIEFFAAFELNKRIHLLANKESIEIFTFDVDPNDSEKRVLTPSNIKSIFDLFNCTNITEEPRTFVHTMGTLIVVFEHILLIILVLFFICFLAYDYIYRVRSKAD